MNYKKIYFAIIKNRRENPLPLGVYGEVHHIIPRSFDGSNKKVNLVRLTAREHFLVHFLLYKMYKHRSQVLFPNSKVEAERYRKMAYAFNLMLRVKSKQSSYINSHVFEQIKKDINSQYVKYTKTQVKEMFDFCVANKITAQNIHLLNDEFDTNFLYRSLYRLLVRHGFKLSDYGFSIKQRIEQSTKYSKEQVQKMFQFYVKNKITKHNIHIFNEHFNMQYSHSSISRLFQRNGLKLSNYDFYQKNRKYSKKMIKEMFKFYVENKINSTTMDVLNIKFNTNFKYQTLTNLFRTNGLKIRQTNLLIGKNKRMRYIGD